MPDRRPRPNDSGAGERIGKYSIHERLGHGAMGEVYRGHDEGLGRDVAIKILAEGHRQNPELRARFVREARAMAKISHPNVVHIYGIEEHEGLPFFVMELLNGRDLGGLLKETGPIAQREAVQVILLAARGLQAAAEIGVVHRDVKPANMVVTAEGLVKLTDFGLAKAIGIDPGLTATGVVVGTPDYIAPEQARGEPTDSKTDVYSLGCSLFHLITGKPPFRVKNGPNTYMAIINRHLNAPRPHLGDVAADVDDEVAAICLKMMSLSPDRRPDFPAVIEQLERIGQRLGSQVPHVDSWAQTGSGITAVGVKGPRGRPAPETSLQGTWISDGVAGVPGWAIILTILCIAVFLVGLGLRLSAP